MATLIPKLRVHFAEFLNEGSPAHLRILSPPTCVGFGTGGGSLPRSFSRQCGINHSLPSLLTPHHASGFQCTDLPMHHPTRLHTLFQSHACLPFCVTPLIKRLLPVLEYQPVVHRLRSLPRIRSRLTLRRRSLLRNPYAFGGKDSHLSFRYSYQHSHFPQVHRTPSSSTSTLWERSPTPYTLRIQPQLRFRTLAPGIFGAGSLDQ